ncbi:alpha/beta fold hydrolase [Undibacterium umbellatum]|uniref:Alpha/beta fold hydrolase n=1 Tax=Undibacterium umbellatum TaxID=2762300 RepID=A0ABR6ZB21_9BURK|nr:alpha/beta fold hydrolase [Undibacterium umbellatum]MBC3908888.1 alpha/beta fold hydrolase [Undibacterium umbellatum]
MQHHTLTRVLIAMGLGFIACASNAACLDNVVLVHGNAGSPSDWNATVTTLKNQGYADAQLYRPNWGSKTNPAINDHGAANTNPVKASLQAAKAASCTGRIDVIGHSMGVTLAMKAINELAYATSVNSFIGIAGAQHGLGSCGVYPFNVMTPTCGSNGLAIDSPLILSVKNKRYGSKMYSIKSYIDEVVCFGSCYVYGSHTSNIDGQNATYDFWLGHFGLKDYTTNTQASLVLQ